jgi:hypothetical protein
MIRFSALVVIVFEYANPESGIAPYREIALAPAVIANPSAAPVGGVQNPGSAYAPGVERPIMALGPAVVSADETKR